jgi:glycosyltransferase involved in cell wall biosynthesis
MQNKRKKVCIAATVPFALVMFMKPHIAMLAEQYDVTLITNGTEQDLSSLLKTNVRFIYVNFERKVSLWRDLKTLFRLYKIFRKERFDIVHSLMPKTGLVAMVAAFFAGVPNRIHTFTGQVWANKVGVVRQGLKTLDRLTASCATSLLADSLSQRQFLVDHHITERSKISVLGNGSVCGVDIERFRPDLIVRQEIRACLGIPDNAIVYLFLGRVNKDKGIYDLAYAFAELAGTLPCAHLLVVGPDEEDMDLTLQLILDKCPDQFHRVGFTDKPEDYMASADVICLPSYREGFGSVIIEAASVGLPAVASNICGLIDAVIDGETGVLHQPGDVDGIKRMLLMLTNDTDMRKKLSKKAMVRAHDLFSTDLVVNAMRQFYANLYLN